MCFFDVFDANFHTRLFLVLDMVRYHSVVVSCVIHSVVLVVVICPSIAR